MTNTRPPLTRDSIVAEAMAIADAEGVAKLSMRNLAKNLGFEVMSLYNHVANKDELLGLMVDAVAGEIDPAPPDVEPTAAIRAIAESTHDALLRHPWAADLWLRHMPSVNRVRSMEDLLRLLAESDLTPDLAHVGFHAVNNHVLGHAMQQIGMQLTAGQESVVDTFLAGLSDDTHHHTIVHVQQHLDGHEGSSFDVVLDLILDGLVRLNEG